MNRSTRSLVSASDSDSAKAEKKPKDNRAKLMELVSYYLHDLEKNESPNLTPELELRFTGSVGADTSSHAIPPISQEDYYSVLQVFKSVDPSYATTSSKEDLLRIYPYASSGKPHKSKIRCEITGILEIQKYCKTNDWRQCDQVKFVMKKSAQKPKRKGRGNRQGEDDGEDSDSDTDTDSVEPIPDVYMESYAIKASYKHEISYDKTQIEEYADTDPEMKFILRNWTTVVKKTFRHMSRFSFTIGDQGLVKMDASIVKSSSQDRNGNFIPAVDIHQSNVLENFAKYEIELEVNNENIGGLAPRTPSRGVSPPRNGKPKPTPSASLASTNGGAWGGVIPLITDQLMSTIRKVLTGLQRTRFPIPKDEMETVLEDYFRVVYQLKEKESARQVIRNDPITSPKYFVGPSSVALKFEHLYPNSITETQDPYVMTDYTVTEKADGERCLLFVSPRTGKIYLIDMNMKVRFTGLCVTQESIDTHFGGLILDGEYVTKDIHDHQVSMFLAFDVYFRHGRDCRSLPFLDDVDSRRKDERKVFVGRYTLLKTCLKEINHNLSNQSTRPLPNACLLGFKEFYVLDSPEAFGVACESLLSKYYPYKIDGLVFTPSYAAVGAEDLYSLEPGPKSKKRWPLSIKWKPAEYNTNDFLVTTVKTPTTNEDEILAHMEPDVVAGAGSPLTEYKTLELRCGFNRYTSGYPGAFLKILSLIGGKDFGPSHRESPQHQPKNDSYLPTLFYPTDYPDKYAHLCRVRLRLDSNGNLQMWTEDGEVIDDQTIVEFKYVASNQDGFRWVPLRIRHDKTYEYRKGGKTYGNDYETANGNWKSIRNPITKEMLMDPVTELPAYDQVKMINDSYYAGRKEEDRHVLQNFHGFVKGRLITSAMRPGHTIIDLACGKAGDLWRWKTAQASFVFGVDYSRDNIENRFDGAAARYMNYYTGRSIAPSIGLRCVFVQGDVSKNVRSGEAMMNDPSKEITDLVFGHPSTERSLGEVHGLSDKGVAGFDVCSCQFALHYFFRDLPTLQGFMTNVCQNVKKGGYFIGTCYDGKRVFDKLRPLPVDGSASIRPSNEDTEYWVCTKKYTQDVFEPDSSSLGYPITVFQKSIGVVHQEYLVNFEYLVRVMENYGFEKVEVTPFEQFYHTIDPAIAREQGFLGLTDLKEWEVSVLNNKFTFRKVKDGFDPTKVVLDTEPIQEKEKEKEEENEKVESAEPSVTTASAPAPASATETDASLEKKRKSRKNEDENESVRFNKTKKNKNTEN